METPVEKHKRLEAELLKSKWDLVYDPTPMPLNKLGRLKFLYLDKAGIENMTGIELGLVLHEKNYIKIVKYIAKDKTGRYLPPEVRYLNLNYFSVEDLPKILRYSVWIVRRLTKQSTSKVNSPVRS